jgi:hypothetical protein
VGHKLRRLGGMTKERRPRQRKATCPEVRETSRRPCRNHHQDWRVVGYRRKLRGEAMIDNRTQVFDVAMKNARTIEACVDRLARIGADHELNLIAGRLWRLSRLSFRTAPSEEAMSVAIASEFSDSAPGKARIA